MGMLIRGTDDKRTPLEHSKDIFKGYLLQCKMNTMSGKKDSGKPIIILTELNKNAGDTLRLHFIPQFTGEAILGQNVSVTGNEKSLDEYFMDIKIDQIAQAVAKKGKMTDRRIIWGFREEAKKQLANWFMVAHEKLVLDALCGFIKDGVNYVENQLTDNVVNGIGRLVVSNGNSFDIEPPNKSNTAQLLTDVVASDKMNVDILESLQSIAKTANEKYPVAPIRLTNGEEYYILLVHPNVARNIRQTSDWKTRSQSIISAGINTANDPIATGAMGIWNRIIIKEVDYIKTHKADAGNVVARNLLLGANACGVMYGQTSDYSEEYRDHHRTLSLACDEISGRSKIVFDGTDIGVIQVVTAANLKN